MENISGTMFQTLGLILDIIGVILLAVGALDKTSPTWNDIEKVSTKARCIYRTAWLGVFLAALGFIFQIFGLYLN